MRVACRLYKLSQTTSAAEAEEIMRALSRVQRSAMMKGRMIQIAKNLPGEVTESVAVGLVI